MLACPFCGCEELEVTSDFDRWYVTCMKCYADGPIANAEIKAMDLWDNQIYFNEKKTRQKEEYPIIWKNIK